MGRGNDGDPAKYATAIREAMKGLNSKLLITEMQPVETLVGRAQAHTRFSLLLIGVFAVAASLLAGVGLYGVLSTVVRQRSGEIGIRMALGAGPVNIFKRSGPGTSPHGRRHWRRPDCCFRSHTFDDHNACGS